MAWLLVCLLFSHYSPSALSSNPCLFRRHDGRGRLGAIRERCVPVEKRRRAPFLLQWGRRSRRCRYTCGLGACRCRLIADGLFWKCAEEFWVEVVALFLLWLVFFHLDAVCVSVGVLANARNLPGNLASRLASRDLETVIGNFFGYINIRLWSTHGCELVTKFTIECLEIVRQCDSCRTVAYGQKTRMD